MASTREYVSRHIYRTPGGSYVDDRRGVRVSARRGESAEVASKRMSSRFRNETGRFETRLFESNYDSRSISGSWRDVIYGSVSEGPQALVPLAYNPNKEPTLASRQAERWLDEQEPTHRHFRVVLGDERGDEA